MARQIPRRRPATLEHDWFRLNQSCSNALCLRGRFTLEVKSTSSDRALMPAFPRSHAERHLSRESLVVSLDDPGPQRIDEGPIGAEDPHFIHFGFRIGQIFG